MRRFLPIGFALIVTALPAVAATPPPYTPDAPPAVPKSATGACVDPRDEAPTRDYLRASDARYNVRVLPVRATPRPLGKKAVLRTEHEAQFAYIPASDAASFLAFLRAHVANVTGDSVVIEADAPHGCRLTLYTDRQSELVADRSRPVPATRFDAVPPLRSDAALGLLIPMRVVAERFGATIAWRKPPAAAKYIEVAYIAAIRREMPTPTYRLEIAPPSATVLPTASQTYTLSLRPLAPSGTPAPYPNGSVTIPPSLGSVVNGTTVQVAANAVATSYPVDPVPAAGEKRKITEVQHATLFVTMPPTVPPTVIVETPSCHWEATRPYVQVLDGTKAPDLGAHVVYVHQPVPAATPAPAYVWNPVFPIDARGRIHGNSDGHVSSVVTISGGDCAPARVAVLVYGDGFVPQRSVAFDYGRASTYDEHSPGNTDWRKYLAHAEIEAPFGLRGAWLSVDARSIGYRHDARSGVTLNCPPLPPAPAPGGATAGDEGCVTRIGGAAQTYRTTFGAQDQSVEVRAGPTLIRHGPVAELAYLRASNNAFRPTVTGVGVALEVPPALDQTFGAYGALAYYPSLSGGGIRYNAWRYRAGATLSLTPFFGRPYYLEIAAVGDRRSNAANAPSSAVYQAVTAGIGIRF